MKKGQIPPSDLLKTHQSERNLAMSRRKRVIHSWCGCCNKPRQSDDDSVFGKLIEFVLPDGALFSKAEFHGNIKWVPEQLAAQGLIWSWQESRNVTDAFDKTLEVCERIGLTQGAKTYTGFM